MKPAEIRKLISVAQQVKARDLAFFAATLRRHEQLTKQIAQVHADEKCNGLSEGHDFEVIGKWHIWAVQKVQALERETRANSIEQDQLRQIAVKSSAKVNSLELLLEQAMKTQLLTNRRRAEQNGVPPDA